MKVGIIGAGTMGSGIAQVFAQAEGYQVMLCDINDNFAAKGKNRILQSYQKRVKAGKMTEEQMETYLEDFLRALPPKELKAECLLPNMVGDLLKKGQLSVSVLHSADRWFGMTYHEDRQAVAQELARLHENGTYPATLRN